MFEVKYILDSLIQIRHSGLQYIIVIIDLSNPVSSQGPFVDASGHQRAVNVYKLTCPKYHLRMSVSVLITQHRFSIREDSKGLESRSRWILDCI